MVSATLDLYVYFPIASEHHRLSTSTRLYCLMAEADVRERLVQGYTRQRGGWDSNPPPVDHESDVLRRGYLAGLLVWRSGNGVRHINEVQLSRARLVLGLVTTFGRSTIPVFIHATQGHSAWPSPRG